MANQETYNPNDTLLSDISVKLRDIEEKQNIIKDRVLLIGENLVAEKEESNEEILDISRQLTLLNEEIKKIKLAIGRMTDDSDNFVRKNEFEILQRQFQMFQPMEMARMTDVEDMINKALRNKKSNLE